jgi:hypothetical protein
MLPQSYPMKKRKAQFVSGLDHARLFGARTWSRLRQQRIAVSLYEKVVVFPAKPHDILLRGGGFADGAGCNAELM